VTTVDLQPLHDGNRILKYADDIYLVVPEVNEHTCESELTYVYEWAATNNLTLNCAKSKELVFCARKVRGRCTQPSPPCRGIERVKSLGILGVVVNDRMTAVDHVSYLLTTCSRQLYALRVLRAHGLPCESLCDVARATVISRLTYCSPAWSGLCSAADWAWLNAVLRRCQRLGYLDDNDAASVEDLFHSADDKLFRKILRNSAHILQPLIPDHQPSSYDLRPRSHDKLLLNKTTYLNERDFVIRMLYRDSY